MFIKNVKKTKCLDYQKNDRYTAGWINFRPLHKLYRTANHNGV